MSKLVELVWARRKKQGRYFKNYLFWAKIIKKTAQKFLGEVRVFIFGSIFKKGEVPRDIDILVVSPKLKTSQKKSEIRAKIWQKIGFFSPFEIHLITPKEYKDWYQYFIKEKKEVK